MMVFLNEQIIIMLLLLDYAGYLMYQVFMIFRFYPTRWVEDQPVAEGALQIWTSFKAVIVYWEGLSKSKRPKNKSYEVLVNNYHDPLIPAKLQFFAFIASIFKPYLTIFQTDRPMVPFMSNELEKIISQLLRLIFKKDDLDQAESIVTKMKRKWLLDTANHLEESLVDLGAATKDRLDQTKVSNEKKQAFKKECKSFILNVLLKLQEHCPLKYSILRNASSLSLQNMVRSNQECSLRFRALVDKLYNLKKISDKTADNSKDQYDRFLKSVQFEHKESFLKSNFKEDRLDKLLGMYLSSEEQYKELWSICHIERGFSVKKEVLQHNMQEKSFISQRLVYDSVQSRDLKLHKFVITTDLRKSCKLAHQRYKQELEDSKQQQKQASKDLKRKNKFDELEKVKKQKLDVQNWIDSLIAGITQETLNAEASQDRSNIVKAVSFVHSLQEKQYTEKSRGKTKNVRSGIQATLT